MLEFVLNFYESYFYSGVLFCFYLGKRIVPLNSILSCFGFLIYFFQDLFFIFLVAPNVFHTASVLKDDCSNFNWLINMF